jgi:hypothetical protein
MSRPISDGWNMPSGQRHDSLPTVTFLPFFSDKRALLAQLALLAVALRIDRHAAHRRLDRVERLDVDQRVKVVAVLGDDARQKLVQIAGADAQLDGGVRQPRAFDHRHNLHAIAAVALNRRARRRRHHPRRVGGRGAAKLRARHALRAAHHNKAVVQVKAPRATLLAKLAHATLLTLGARRNRQTAHASSHGRSWPNVAEKPACISMRTRSSRIATRVVYNCARAATRRQRAAHNVLQRRRPTAATPSRRGRRRRRRQTTPRAARRARRAAPRRALLTRHALAVETEQRVQRCRCGGVDADAGGQRQQTAVATLRTPAADAAARQRQKVDLLAIAALLGRHLLKRVDVSLRTYML